MAMWAGGPEAGIWGVCLNISRYCFLIGVRVQAAAVAAAAVIVVVVVATTMDSKVRGLERWRVNKGK